MFSSTQKSLTSASHADGDVSSNWQWVLELFDEANLPKLGLPVRWETTKNKHALIVFNPDSNETTDITTGRVTKHKKSPVDFIYSTKNKTPMPGTQAPAAVRYARYTEPKLNSAITTDPSGQYLAPCIVHGDYVHVETLSADHIQAKSEIMRRQKALIDKLNENIDFAEFVMSQEGMSKFFVKVDGQFYGTLFFYELYFNDIDNIWLICDACNRQKSAQETVSWLEKQWLYGKEFLDYLGMIKDDAILKKTQDNEGLAKVAIEWFWQRHAHYISVTKKLLQDIVTPIKILNQHIDHIVGSGNQKRAERLQASLDAKLLILEKIAQAPGLSMPRHPDESPASSSDEDQYLKDKDGNPIYTTVEDYTSVMTKVADSAPTVMQQIATQRFQKNDEKKTEGRNKRLLPPYLEDKDKKSRTESNSKRPRTMQNNGGKYNV